MIAALHTTAAVAFTTLAQLETPPLFEGDTDTRGEAVEGFFKTGFGNFLEQVSLWAAFALIVYALIKNANKLTGGGGAMGGGGGPMAFLKGILPALLAAFLLIRLEFTWGLAQAIGSVLQTGFEFVQDLLGFAEADTPTTPTSGL